MPSLQKTDGFSDTAILTQGNGYLRFGKPAQQKLTDEETGQLLSLTALSLSAFHINHCRFVVVRDPELRKQVQKFFPSENQPSPIASFIILCADLRPREKTQAGQGENGPEGRAETLSSCRNRDPKERDEAMYACGIAAQTLMLTAKAMGFDCWRLTGVDAAGLGALINLPEDYVVAMLLVVGKNIKPAPPHPYYLDYHDVVVIDQF